MSKMEQLLVFALAGIRCALPLSEVERILSVVAIQHVPRAPDSILGLINVQGRILPVLDLRHLFCLPNAECNLDDQLIIARSADRPLAILVDNVIGVIDYDKQDIIEPDQLFPGIEYLEGVAKLSDGIIYIYNLGKFCNAEWDEKITSLLDHESHTDETDVTGER